MTFIPSPLLRQALLADAVTSGAFGLLLTLGSGPLAPLLGLPVSLLFAAGLSLLPFAALLAILATRPALPRGLVWAAIAANTVWALDSLLLVGSGWVEPTRAGTAFVLAQAFAVALYAELQFLGLRRSQATAAV